MDLTIRKSVGSPFGIQPRRTLARALLRKLVVKYIAKTTLGLLAGVLAAIPSANATGTAQMRVSGNGGLNWITVKDFDGDGNVSFAGTIGGNWSISLAAGSTKPALGSSADPILNLSASSLSSAGAGTLIIEFSDTYYGPLPSGNSFTTSLDSDNVGSGKTSVWSYLGLSNGTFQRSSLLGSIVETGSDASATKSSGALAGYSLFSLTMRVAIYHDGAGLSSFGATLVDPPPAAPEGGSTVALLGFGLLVLAASTAWIRRVRAA